MRNFTDGRPQPGPRAWFHVKAKSQKEPAEVFIYDEIGRGFFGGGVAAEDFIAQLKALELKSGDDLVVRINSPGGNLFDGTTIYNYLRTVKAKVTVRVDGVAASAASIIAMAGDRVEMPENSFLFIHNPWMVAAGDSAVMRKAAEDLDQMREGAVATYLRRTAGKISRDQLVEMLDAETWLTAEQSVAHGFADAVDEPVRAAALAAFDLERYGYHVPPAVAQARKDRAAAKRAGLQALKTDFRRRRGR